MYKITTLSDADIFPKKTHTVARWKKRKTVKILLINNKNELAFVTNPIHGFYLLPGGGIQDNEDFFSAANRECQEEVGYSIVNIKLVGYIEEWRSRDGMQYESVCVSAEIGIPTKHDLRTKEEKKNGMIVRWVSLADACLILKNQASELKQGKIFFYNTAFNIARDHIFFEKYKQHLNSLVSI